MYVDPRGPRFAAAVTTVVLAVALLLTGSTSASPCWPCRRSCSRSAPFVGLQASPYGAFVQALSSGRGWHRRSSSRTPGPPRFAQAVGSRSPSSAPSASPPAPRLAGHRRDGAGPGRRLPQRRVRVLPGLRDVLSCVAPVASGCAGVAPPPAILMRHRRPPTVSPTARGSHQERHMSRIRRPGRRRLGRGPSRRPDGRPRRGRRGHRRLRRRTTSAAPCASTGRPTCRTRSAATSSTRSSSRRCCPRKGISNDDTVVLYGGNNNWFAAYAYWYFKLYGHDDVKLLDGGRKKWELDSRELVADVAERAGDAATRPRRRTSRSARSATTCWTRSAPRTWSTCARPTSTPAGCSPRRTCRRSSRSGRATSRPRRTSRGARRPTTTARSRPTTTSTALYDGEGVDLTQGHHRLLPDRRALGAHLVRAARAARHRRTCKNYDGSWTEYGSLVGVPVQTRGRAGIAEGGAA